MYFIEGYMEPLQPTCGFQQLPPAADLPTCNNPLQHSRAEEEGLAPQPAIFTPGPIGSMVTSGMHPTFSPDKKNIFLIC